jgi:hypothetical protein
LTRRSVGMLDELARNIFRRASLNQLGRAGTLPLADVR